MKHNGQHLRIIAVDPCLKGFGFAVLEGGTRLLDWGVARVWGTSEKEFVARVEDLLLRYRSKCLVLEDLDNVTRVSRRTRRVRVLEEYGKRSRLQLLRVSRASVQSVFQNTGVTKREIALAISHLFPELGPHLPPVRKPWMSEDERMNVFDAVSLALTIIPS